MRLDLFLLGVLLIWNYIAYIRTRSYRDTSGTCHVYCPDCCKELGTAPGELLCDLPHEGVRYECARCKCLSCWDFDPPAPILLWHIKH